MQHPSIPLVPSALLLPVLLHLSLLLAPATALAADGAPGAAAAAADTAPAWQEWSPQVWDHAQAQHALVLLEVGARWCHWCNVMDRTTYRDPGVLSLLKQHYLTVHVDQAVRPDIANRYEDYGWPATIIFDASGHELVKRRGYIPPEAMSALLQAVVADPTPGPSVSPEAPRSEAAHGGLPADLRNQLLDEFRSAYDPALGGWGAEDKYLDATAIEEAWSQQDDGDGAAAQMASTSLDQALALIDPVWGGVCQYSVGDWKHLHYEKIDQVQADALRTYALAYARTGDARYRDAVLKIHSFITGFLTAPDGGFYASQDADVIPGVESTTYYALTDAQRRAKGLPRMDQHRFAREQGWLIDALVVAAGAGGDEAALREAEAAAAWTLAHRQRPDGGFSHDQSDAGGPFLGDTLAMGQAFLRLYRLTGNGAYLGQAEAARIFIDRMFQDPQGGYATAAAMAGLPSAPERDENISLARWALALAADRGDDASDRACAERAARFLDAPGNAKQQPVGGILLADEDYAGWRMRILVAGSAADPLTAALARQAARDGLTRVAILRWEAAAGAPPSGLAAALTQPAAYVQVGASPWSAPITHDLLTALAKISSAPH
jgi:uncharacterized protein YyaL (SSP411 family)